MQMAGEMMDDALDGALDDDGVEEETGDLVDQVGSHAFLHVALTRCHPLPPSWGYRHGLESQLGANSSYAQALGTWVGVICSVWA